MLRDCYLLPNLEIYARSSWIINKYMYTVLFKPILYLIREENSIVVIYAFHF